MVHKKTQQPKPIKAPAITNLLTAEINNELKAISQTTLSTRPQRSTNYVKPNY